MFEQFLSFFSHLIATEYNLQLLGIIFDILGTFYISKGFIFKTLADIKSETYGDPNPNLGVDLATSGNDFVSRLAQREEARIGFLLLLIGFILQGVGVIFPNISLSLFLIISISIFVLLLTWGIYSKLINTKRLVGIHDQTTIAVVAPENSNTLRSKIKNLSWRYVRFSVIAVPPFILVVVLYFLFSVKGNLEIGKPNNIENDIRPYISRSLLKQEGRLEFLTPVVNPRWFLYSVKFRNDKKLAVQSDTGDPQYSEREVLLTLLISGEKKSIRYGEDKFVSHNKKREEILNEFSGYGFFLEGAPNQVFPPGSIVNIQDNPSNPSLGYVTYKIVLSLWSMLLTYFLTLVAWSGLILIAKPIFQFVYYGKQWWYKI